jgi:hypothetical protein
VPDDAILTKPFEYFLATMGGWQGHRIFDVDWKKVRKVLHECHGKRAALEASGLLFNLLKAFCGSKERAKHLAHHIHANGPLDFDAIRYPLESFVSECEKIRSLVHRLVVVFEGAPYCFKDNTHTDRLSSALKAFQAEKYQDQGMLSVHVTVSCALFCQVSERRA